MQFVVARLIHSPTAGDVRTARLVVTGVPDKTSVADLAAALTAAGRAADFSEGGVPFGNHELRAEGRQGWPKGIGGIEAAPAVTWERLTTPPTPAEGRRITLRLAPAEHARYTLAAQAAGASLQQWCMTALAEAEARGRGPAPGSNGRKPAAEVGAARQAAAAS